MATLTEAYSAGKRLSNNIIYQACQYSDAGYRWRMRQLGEIGIDPNNISDAMQAFYAGLTWYKTSTYGPSYSPYVNV